MTIKRRNPLFRGAALALTLAAWFSPDAQAISISIGPATDNTITTFAGSTGDRGEGRLLQVTNSGTNTGPVDIVGVAGQAIGSTRFAANVAADRSGATSGGSAVAQDAVNYSVTFTVTPAFAGTTYELFIDTSIFGAASAREENSGIGGGGVASMSNVSGFLNSNPNAALNLASAATRNGTSNTSGQDTAFSASNVLDVGLFSGPQTFTLSFAWTMRAESPQNIIGGDEQAVRLGFSDPLGGSNADNYPGSPSRVVANDGHFVNIRAVPLSVPEPTTLALAAIGIAGVGCVALRRRRQR